MISPEKWYSPQELEDMGKEGIFPVREKITILKLIETGKLPATNVGTNAEYKVWKIKGADILAFLDSRGTFTLYNDDQKTRTRTRGKTKEKKAPSDSKKKV